MQVHVTDWPEWRHRTRKVSASFEAGIAAETVVLYARPATDVTWDKEIGLPADNIGEALGRLDEAAKALNDLLGHTRLSNRAGPHTGQARAVLEPLAASSPDDEGNLYGPSPSGAAPAPT